MHTIAEELEDAVEQIVDDTSVLFVDKLYFQNHLILKDTSVEK